MSTWHNFRKWADDNNTAIRLLVGEFCWYGQLLQQLPRTCLQALIRSKKSCTSRPKPPVR